MRFALINNISVGLMRFFIILAAYLIVEVALFLPAYASENYRTGSGFVIGDGTLVVTAAHVVGERQCVIIQKSDHGDAITAYVVARDQRIDLALLRIREAMPPLPIADWSQIAPGEVTYVLGYPLPDILGPSPKITSGHLNGFPDPTNSTSLFQTDAPLQNGSSGGPVLSEKGEVLGVVRARMTILASSSKTIERLQNVNFAVSSNALLIFLQKLLPELTFGPVSSNALSARQIYARSYRSVVLVKAAGFKKIKGANRNVAEWPCAD